MPRIIYYNNFASHLLNAYNPNMLYPGLPNQWTASDWTSLIDMLDAFGFNVFEFWLEPRLFCREGLDSEYGRHFTEQIEIILNHAHSRCMQVELIAGLATVGSDWRTLCPNLPADWAEIQYLWEAWARRLPDLDIIGIFPGDPGACSRNGCTALTYIDKSIEIAHLLKRTLPTIEVEFNTWGPPFFGWGNLTGPEGWQGEFIPEYQHSAWDFDPRRAEESMNYLLQRLPAFPDPTSVSLNMGFNGDGNPIGEQDARPWVKRVAQTHPVYTWDFSLTEGENNIVPHYRFRRLFDRRLEEQQVGAYRGGICFTMTPLLNQLSLYEAAQSFRNPYANPDMLAGDFFEALFGPTGREVVPYLPLFEVIQDWGNYHHIDLPRGEYHGEMSALAALIESLHPLPVPGFPFHPSPEAYRQELLFYARLFTDLSAPQPDYPALHQAYWQRIYAIYDHLPPHVDPRPHAAVDRLVEYFINLR